MLELASIFNDGMILQRNSHVRIWGTSDKEQVEISFLRKVFRTVVSNGKWVVDIDTNDSRTEETMTIIEYDNDQQTDSRIIKDILLGEVWFAGGQSNMELELINSENGKEVVKKSDYDEIRFFIVPKCAYIDSEYTDAWKETGWKKAKGKQCENASAVAYYFARNLYEELNVPVGIIGCYWGGTSATCWISEKYIDGIDEVNNYIDGWNSCCISKSDEQYAKEMEAYEEDYNNWVNAVEGLREKNPLISWIDINEIAGPCPWPQPRGRKSPFRPFGLHETMVSKVASYGIKGFIYYQAEEDSDKAEYYHKLNSAVIEQFRNDFSIEKDVKKPFYILQLPMYQENGKLDDKTWCTLRQEQKKCSDITEETYIVSLIDLGEFDNIHPVNKEIPGTRLAERVLNKTYHIGEDIEYLECCKVNFKNTECVLSFENEYDGICVKYSEGTLTGTIDEAVLLTDNSVSQVKGLEASVNGIDYFRPIIKIEDGQMHLSTEEEERIISVRYAWFNYGIANLYNSHKYPLLPFCISDNNI